MLRRFPLVFAIAAALSGAGFDWNLPKGFPRPAVPENNPMNEAKVELGRRLFYDKRMSVNGKMSCGSCHRQELAFTDGRAQAEGTTGELHPRSSMSLVNIAYVPLLTWANPALASLEEQALVPMLGHSPVELGLKGRELEFASTLRADVDYQRLFPMAFPGESDVFTLQRVAKAIAAFERTIVSMGSPYDRYRWGGDSSAISASAKRGELIFSSSERGGCFQCHGGWNFSGSVRFEGGPVPSVEFQNTGLYVTYPAVNSGLQQHTHRAEDAGKFRAPSLRNIAVTGPYMHDGSIPTLEAVIDHYATGGRARTSPNKSAVIKGFTLTAQDKLDLIEFLNALTDRELLSDPRWSDPWPLHHR